MTEAVQTLEPPTHRYKRGDVREDGLIFWSYAKQGGYEYWVSKEKFLDKKTKTKLLKSKWKKENKEIIRNQKAVYNKNNKEKVKEWNIKYKQNNQKKIKESRSIYYNSNKEKIIKKSNIIDKNRKKTDKLYALSKSVRCNIRQALGKRGYTKKSRTHEILGCSFEFFKNHIEQRFQEGMTWENRSEWHLDHIIPVSSGKTEKEIIKLNHYTNLRPLWAEENLKKWKHQNKQLELIK
jgi:hypothetical protein